MESEKNARVCILGAGTAGMAAAYALKNKDFKVIVVDKQAILGGTAVNAWVETWIEGINPPYLNDIFKQISSLTVEDINRSWLPSNFALKGKGGKNLFVPHEQLSAIYLKDMKESINIELLCGYRFQDALINNNRIEYIRVVSIDASEVIKISACFFIDCSGGELCRYHGIKDMDYFVGEDPYSRFEEPLMVHTVKYSMVNYDYLNEPSLFFKVGTVEKIESARPISIEKQNKIDSHVDYIYNGYYTERWINPMTGMNISGNSVINLGEDAAYKMAKSHIHSYWEFICQEIERRKERKNPSDNELYGYASIAESYVNMFPLSDIESCAEMLGIRETYRIHCMYMTTEHDLSKSILEEALDDNIACGSHGLDFHVYGNLNASKVSEFNSFKLQPSGISYRSLIPKRFSNVLVAGKAFGASHIALSARRVNKDMAQLGWAAGNAIRICLEQNKEDTYLSPQEISLLQSDSYTHFAKNVDYLKTICDEKKVRLVHK